jgi:hypothetical protein
MTADFRTAGHPYAEDAKDAQMTQRIFLEVPFCVLCVPSASSAYGCSAFDRSID